MPLTMAIHRLTREVEGGGGEAGFQSNFSPPLYTSGWANNEHANYQSSDSPMSSTVSSTVSYVQQIIA